MSTSTAMPSRFPADTSKTPILDQIAAPDPDVYWDARPSGHPFVSSIILILFGLVVWIAGFQNYLWFDANVLVSYVCLILAWYPCCFIHELGHLLTALLLRRRLLGFRLGLLSIAKHRDRIQIRLERNNWIIGGAVQCLPTRRSVSRCGEAAIALAGPAATALLAMAVLGARPLTEANVPAWEVPLLCIAVFSTLTNLLPFKTDIYASDGYQLVGLLGRGGIARCAFAAMLGAISRGQLPSAAIIARATAYARNPIDYVQANFIAYQLTLPFRFEPALLYLEAALGRCEGTPRVIRARLYREAAYVQANRARTEAALEWFRRAEALDDKATRDCPKHQASLLPLDIRMPSSKRLR